MSPASFASSAGATLTGFFACAAGESASGRVGGRRRRRRGVAPPRPSARPRRASAPTTTSAGTRTTTSNTRSFDIFMAPPPRDRGRSTIPRADPASPDTAAAPRSRPATSAATGTDRTCPPASPRVISVTAASAAGSTSRSRSCVISRCATSDWNARSTSSATSRSTSVALFLRRACDRRAPRASSPCWRRHSGIGIATPPPTKNCPGRSRCRSDEQRRAGDRLAPQARDVGVDLVDARRQRRQLGALRLRRARAAPAAPRRAAPARPPSRPAPASAPAAARPAAAGAPARRPPPASRRPGPAPRCRVPAGPARGRRSTTRPPATRALTASSSFATSASRCVAASTRASASCVPTYAARTRARVSARATATRSSAVRSARLTTSRRADRWPPISTVCSACAKYWSAVLGDHAGRRPFPARPRPAADHRIGREPHARADVARRDDVALGARAPDQRTGLFGQPAAPRPGSGVARTLQPGGVRERPWTARRPATPHRAHKQDHQDTETTGHFDLTSDSGQERHADMGRPDGPATTNHALRGLCRASDYA